jgi:ATP-dependent Clp protease ATP-binding subunit ClpC
MQVTPRCQQAIDFARSLSVGLGHQCLSSGHLIYGLLTVNCGAGAVLRAAGFTPDGVEDYLRKNRPEEQSTTLKGGVAVGITAIGTMERAESEARDTNCNYVGTEHVLLALLEEQRGTASGVLDASKCGRTTMRQSLIGGLSSSMTIKWPPTEQ